MLQLLVYLITPFVRNMSFIGMYFMLHPVQKTYNRTSYNESNIFDRILHVNQTNNDQNRKEIRLLAVADMK